MQVDLSTEDIPGWFWDTGEDYPSPNHPLFPVGFDDDFSYCDVLCHWFSKHPTDGGSSGTGLRFNSDPNLGPVEERRQEDVSPMGLPPFPNALPYTRDADCPCQYPRPEIDRENMSPEDLRILDQQEREARERSRYHLSKDREKAKADCHNFIRWLRRKAIRSGRRVLKNSKGKGLYWKKLEDIMKDWQRIKDQYPQYRDSWEPEPRPPEVEALYQKLRSWYWLYLRDMMELAILMNDENPETLMTREYTNLFRSANCGSSMLDIIKDGIFSNAELGLGNRNVSYRLCDLLLLNRRSVIGTNPDGTPITTTDSPLLCSFRICHLFGYNFSSCGFGEHPEGGPRRPIRPGEPKFNDLPMREWEKRFSDWMK